MKGHEMNATETPETDAEELFELATKDHPSVSTQTVFISFARSLERRLAAMTRERDEALKWKNEDPRMLREQIRVADVAFNALTERHNQAEAERDEARAMVSVAREALGAIESTLGHGFFPDVTELQKLTDALARLNEMEKA
jgi:hypothetical protein